MNLKRRNIALLLAISSMSGIITPTILNLKEINSYAYNEIINLSEDKKQAYGIKKVVATGYSTFFIKNNGTVWACGSNNNGQLGIGNNTNQNIPVQVPITDIKDVICGASHTMFIKNDGTVWSCGKNEYYELGINNNYKQTIPVQVPINNVKKVTAQYNYTMFLKEDGTVWATGYNKYGQLGMGSTIRTPTKLNIDNVKDISCSKMTSFFIKEDGTVWTCGNNSYGQLGIGNNTNQTTPVKLNITNVKYIDCSDYHTVFLKEDGTVWNVGDNSSGQLGISNTNNQNIPIKVDIDNVKDIMCGHSHTIVLKEDGTVWVYGNNSSGEIGIGDISNSIIPIKVEINNVKDITTGTSHTMFIKNDGTVWATGYNNYGQISDEITGYKTTPFEIKNLINNLYTAEELVLKAEISKTQSDFDVAKNKVDELSDTQLKTELQNRLDILEIEINKYNNPTYNKLLQNAKDKLEKAQSSKSNIDITFAQLAIDKLNPEDKATLQEQLNNLKEQIKIEKEELNYAKFLEDAEIKVTKAESSKKDYDITVAQNSINKLKVEDKPQFQDRLDLLVYNILLEDANVKVTISEDLRTDNSINIAQIAIDKVPHKEVTTFDLLETELLEKPILQSKLDNLKLSIEEERYLKLKEDAILKVTTAEETKSLKDIKLAQMAIDRLKENDKTELQERLNALNQLIKDEEKEKNALKLATTKVEQAEKLNTQKYIDEAKELVENLKPSSEKDLLLDRLTAIETNTTKTDEKTKTLIYQADVYVKQAEALKRESYIIKAQAGIDKIPNDNPEKALLQTRLDKITVKK